MVLSNKIINLKEKAMKVNISGVLVNMDGKKLLEDYVDDEGKQQKRDLTFFNVIRNSVLMVSETNKTGIEKYQLYTLAKKVVDGDCDFSANDIVKIKTHVGECYNPLVVGQVWDLLEATKVE